MNSTHAEHLAARVLRVRFMRPSPSSKTRRRAQLGARSGRPVRAPSPLRTPSSTSRPGPIAAIVSPSTVTAALLTRWTSARTARSLLAIRVSDGGRRTSSTPTLTRFPARRAARPRASGALTLAPEHAGGWPLDVGLRLADGLLSVRGRFALPAPGGHRPVDSSCTGTARRAWRASPARASGDLGARRPAGGRPLTSATLDRLLGLVRRGRGGGAGLRRPKAAVGRGRAR